MSLVWLLRLSERTHFLVFPGLVALVAGGTSFGVLLATEGGFVRETLAAPQIVGTLLLFVLLPTYLSAMIPVMERRTRASLHELDGVAREDDIAAVTERMQRTSAAVWPATVVGVLFGLSQNTEVIRHMASGEPYALFDFVFVFQATVVWVFVAVLLTWRVPTSRAISQLGERIQVDLLRMDRLAPLARIATGDILAVVGAMALSPLQSLDAAFRLGNYMPSVIVGLPAAAALFLLPLWGLHRNLARTKQARLDALRARLDELDGDDLAAVEPVAAHLDRIASLPTWPVDFEVARRIAGYVVIPPAAWVAAALVENLVDSL